MRTTICLCMIVKNEAHVIERCLASVRPLITSWVIVDTGSTDGTQALVRSTLFDVPGDLYERPWRDFAHNRSEALVLARGRADYVLVIDADDVLEIDGGVSLPRLELDAYRLRVRHGALSFHRLHLLRDACEWRYEGVLHEHAVSDRMRTSVTLDGIRYQAIGGGDRSRDREKYRRDVEVLRGAVEREPANARYRFYLAQSYRDAGELEAAVEHYRLRRAMGGWDEEVYYADLQIGILLDRLGRSSAEVSHALLRAYQFRPQRAESLYELARACRGRGDHALANLFARGAVATPRPDDKLFVDESVYEWRALDELAIAAAAVGDRDAAVEALSTLLERELPSGVRRRVKRNLATLRGQPLPTLASSTRAPRTLVSASSAAPG